MKVEREFSERRKALKGDEEHGEPNLRDVGEAIFVPLIVLGFCYFIHFGLKLFAAQQFKFHNTSHVDLFTLHVGSS